MGLLSKASEIIPNNTLAFSDFLITNDIKTFAIFENKNNFFKIINSIGFDGSSLLSSNSSLDFWQGICTEKNKIYNFTCYNKTLNPILQFFSFGMKDQINTVSLYMTDKFIYMLCNKDLTEKILSSIRCIDFSLNSINLDQINKTITSHSVILEYEIDINNAVKDYLLKKKVNESDYNIFYNSVFNVIYNKFLTQISPYSSNKTDNNLIRFLINTDKETNDNILISHLIFSFTNIIGSSAQLINFTKYGTAESINDIISFFQVQ